MRRADEGSRLLLMSDAPDYFRMADDPLGTAELLITDGNKTPLIGCSDGFEASLR